MKARYFSAILRGEPKKPVLSLSVLQSHFAKSFAKSFLDNQRQGVYERGVLGPCTSEHLTGIAMLSHRGYSR